MVRTQISLDADMYDAAKAEARRQGISLAQLVRTALAAALSDDREGHPWMRYAGALACGDPDASRSVNVVVYGRGRP